MPKAKDDRPVITAKMVKAAKAACKEFRRIYGAQRAAERGRDALLGELFVTMGFASLDEVKAMSPEKLAVEVRRRAGKQFAFESDAARAFAIVKTWEGRFPKWKEAVVEASPQRALEIEIETPVQYSYAIVDPPGEPDPNIISLR